MKTLTIDAATTGNLMDMCKERMAELQNGL